MINSVKTNIFGNKTLVFGAIGLTIGGFGISKSLATIPPNHIGYINLFGDLKEKKLYPGIHLINPFSSIVKIPLLTSNLSSEIDVATKEGLSLNVETNIMYKINEDKPREIYLKYLFAYETIYIKPLIESRLRNIISSYEAKDLYSENTRNEIKNKMNDQIKQLLLTDGFEVSDIMINKIKLPTQLRNSIENKLKSEQENEQMSFIIEKEKKQLIFGLEKEKMESERKTIEANGIKGFQDIVSKGISKELIAWKGIEATEKIAKSPNAKIIIIGNKDSNGLPIMISDK